MLVEKNEAPVLPGQRFVDAVAEKKTIATKRVVMIMKNVDFLSMVTNGLRYASFWTLSPGLMTLVSRTANFSLTITTSPWAINF